MCGICGLYSKRNITREQLSSMNDSMAFRGPDDAGVELWDMGSGRILGMAQRRLSILDLSPSGHQPMTSNDGRVSIVYNGEIYNFREIRRELAGYQFHSDCDTEVILAAYLKWGIRCVEHFNGMFAFALFDRDSRTLYLARDRMGQKPLYYWLDGENIVFASTLAPIMQAPGFRKTVRREVLARYLYQEYINAPETIFEDVWQVESGTVLAFDCADHKGASAVDGGVSWEEWTEAVRNRHSPEGTESCSGGTGLHVWKYWDVAHEYAKMQEEPVTDFTEAKSELKRLLQDAVRRRMIADVPLGTFLSGGYDSSLISALAQEQLGSTPLKTFAVGFDEKEYDESPFAREVAQHLGTDHTEMVIGEKDMLDLVSDLPKYFDEPMADSSEIPTMLVSKLARQKVTVALSGDAGDEFFCGYGIYDNVRRAQELDSLGALAHSIGQIPMGRGKRLEDHYPFRARVIAANRNPETKTQFGTGSYENLALRMILPWDDGSRAGAAGRTAGESLPVNYEWETRYPSDNWQVKRMLLDMETYLPGDILTKVDRASMKYSLENRCPFLDPEVMRYSYRLDHSFKYHKEKDGSWSKKYILKSIAYDYIPKDILDRPKKGFSVPLSKWLRGPLLEQLMRYTNRQYLKEQGIFDPDSTINLVAQFVAEGDAGAGTGRNYSKLVWSFFVFQQWADYYL